MMLVFLLLLPIITCVNLDISTTLEQINSQIQSLEFEAAMLAEMRARKYSYEDLPTYGNSENVHPYSVPSIDKLRR